MKPQKTRKPHPKGKFAEFSEPETLNPGNPKDPDGVFIAKAVSTGPRLAVEAVAPGGTVRFGSPGDASRDIKFSISPFTVGQPQMGGEYTVAEGADGEYLFQVEGYKKVYAIYVHSTGVASAEFNWDDQKNKLLCYQYATSDRSVYFTRGEPFDDEMYEGDILVQVLDAPDSYVGNPRLLVPSNKENGCWTPGVEGSFRVKVVTDWNDVVEKEDTGSDEGDIFIDPPPP